MTRIRRPGFPVLLAALALGGLMLALSPAGAPPVDAQQGSVPDQPTGLVTTAVHDSVALSWNDPGDTSITHYQVLRRDRDVHAAGEFVTIKENTGSPATSYTDTTVAPERRYTYRVQAVNRHGVSQWSSFARADTPAAPAPPPEDESSPADLAPSGLTAEAGADGGVALTWTAPAADAAAVTGYELLRAAGKAEPASLALTAVTSTAHTDTTATQAGETYSYQVKALRDQEQSEGSNRASVTLPQHTPGPGDAQARQTKPGTPTLVEVGAGDTKLRVIWKAPPPESGAPINTYDLRYIETSADEAIETNWTVIETIWDRLGMAGPYEYTLTALTNGTGYDVQVRARAASGPAGTGDWSNTLSDTPAAVPDAPGAPQVTRSDGMLDFTWSAPADNGTGAITSYDLRYRAGSGDWTEITGVWTETDGGALAGNLPNLTNGVTYRLQVRAVNANGGGLWSAGAEGVPATLPGVPRFVTKWTSGDGYLGVLWSSPESDGGANVTHYDLRYIETSANAMIDGNWTEKLDVSTRASSYRLTGLTNLVEYRLQLRAVNDVGPGPWDTGFKDTPRKPPGPPSIDLVTSADGSLTIAYSPPPVVEGAGDIASYRLSWIRGHTGGLWSVANDLPTSAPLEYTISGLNNGARYTLELRVYDEFGDYNDSVRAVGIPGAPTSPAAPTIDALTASSGAFSITWEAPYNGGAAITSYDLRYIRNDAASKADANWTLEEEVWSAGALWYALSGLTDWVAYDVQVRAENSVGVGAWSATKTGTPGTAPSAPTIDEVYYVDDEFRRMLMEWTAPTSDGGSTITNYHVRFTYTASQQSEVFDDFWDPSKALGVVLPLNPHDVGVEVGFEVRAVNVAAAGPWSAMTTWTTPGTPDAPTGVTAVAADRKIIVTWEAAVTGDAAVIAYDLRYRWIIPGSPNKFWTLIRDVWTPGSGELRYTRTGVPNHREHGVQVRARNHLSLIVSGEGWSATVRATPVPLPTVQGDAAVLYEENGSAAVHDYHGDVSEGSVSWSLSGDDAGAFSVNTDGLLRFKASPDYEDEDDQNADNDYLVTVEATVETETDSYTGSLEVVVTVTDDDEAPVVSGRTSVNYPENSTAAVADYDAEDPEGAAITWSLAGDDDGAFHIDNGGVLTFRMSPDYEAPPAANRDNVYNVTVQASDGNETGTRAVTVTVTNDDEPPVISGPATVGYDEGDTGQVADYDAPDPEGATIVWSLSGSDANDFSIDANGVLRFNSPPDFETGGGSYTVTVRASDGANPVTQPVTVTVNNLDEQGTVTLSSAQPQVGTLLFATFDDPDGTTSNESWTWARSTDGSSWTDISAVLSRFYTPVADDVGNYLRVTVSYDDGHGSGKNAQESTDRQVRAAPVSNQDPVFSEQTPARSVMENSGPGTPVGAPVTADDPDGDTLTYAISGGRTDLFSVEGNGQIRVKPGATLDYETGTTSYSITLEAADPSDAVASVDVSITITDVDEPPVAINDEARTSEDTAWEFDVLANDEDPEDPSGQSLTISLRQSPANGVVKLADDSKKVSYTPRDNFNGFDTFTYRAFDGANYSADATVVVTVLALNDDPVFPAGPFDFSVQEGAPGATLVGTPVTATDIDGETLEYTLTGSPHFEIDLYSGQISVAPGAVLDAEDTHTVTVRAEDTGILFDEVDVTITVTESRPVRRTTGGGGGGGGGGPSGPSPSELDFEWNVKRDLEALDGGHDTPTGAWSDGTTLWVLENGDGAGDAIYAYDLNTGERLEEREFELDERNRAPRGVWSGGTVIWVSDSGQDRLFGHDLETGERLPERDLELDEDNGAARGIWSDGERMWVLDGGKDSLFAYDLGSGALVAEYALDDANGDPHGIWSDGVTIWVSDHGAKRLFAYRLEDGELVRNSEEEFTELSKASNNSPRGIWSDGEVIYVADESDDKVYSYNMPDAIDARLASLTLSGIEIGEFSGDRTEYDGVAAEGVTETTVEAEALQRRTTVLIEPADAGGDDTNGHQLALEGIDAITVTVTSADGSRTRVYRVRLGDPDRQATPDPWTHCLRGDIAEGFSLVVYEGGSVEELVTCAESRDVVALYALHGGVYVSYILGAPGFVNQPFAELFADGVPPVMPLVAGSSGPPSTDPNLGDGALLPWPECLRGEIAAGFSLVIYEGGSVDDLVACAESLDVTALYALHDDQWVSYILGAPEFVNRPFRELFTDGLPPLTPLTARSAGPPAAN